MTSAMSRPRLQMQAMMGAMDKNIHYRVAWWIPAMKLSDQLRMPVRNTVAWPLHLELQKSLKKTWSLGVEYF